MKRIAVALLASACAAGPEPLPMRGPQPAVVLVAPSVPPLGSGPTDELDAAIDTMLRERGYATHGGADALGKLIAVGWQPGVVDAGALPLDALRSRFGVEAVWVSDVRAWAYGAGGENAFRFDVSAALVATKDGRELWGHSVSGAEPAVRRRTGPDPFADPDPFEAEDPIGWVVVEDVLSPGEAAMLIARAIGARLPAR